MSDSEVWVLVAFGVAVLIAYALAGSGLAALFFLWFPRLGRAAAAFLASLIVPLLFAIFITFMAASFRGSVRPAEVLLAIAIGCAPGVLIGWPSAFLTLRGLHKRIERAGVTAQEMFE